MTTNTLPGIAILDKLGTGLGNLQGKKHQDTEKADQSGAQTHQTGV